MKEEGLLAAGERMCVCWGGRCKAGEGSTSRVVFQEPLQELPQGGTYKGVFEG